jgi:aromatic-L-amino-acid decarboxylase
MLRHPSAATRSPLIESNRIVNPAQLIAREIETFPNEVRDLRVAPMVSSNEIRRRLERYTFAEEVSLSDALGDVAGMLRQWTLHSQHPRYFGLFVPGVHEAGIWADALAALYNPQVGAWWHSPAANEIETHTLNFLAAVIGYDARVAQFTTGGSEANLTALLAAIASAYPSSAQQGVAEAAAKGKVYVSSQAHHSIHKAVRIAGLGTGVLRIVPCNARHQMNVEALREIIAADMVADCRPIMIVGTAGTTTAGAIDDLAAIGEIAREQSAWFHAGAAGFSPRLRPLLHGIEKADSVTWDAHKWLSVPMGAGMFFCTRSDVLHSLFGVDAAYVPKKTDEGDDLYLTSLQWSRRFIGLKVFLTLATQSRDGVGARIERQADVAQSLRERLTDDGWLVVNETPLPLVCFTHPALNDRASADAVAQHVVSGGRAWISAASLPEGRVLRACITHDDCTSADVDVLREELGRALAAVAT